MAGSKVRGASGGDANLAQTARYKHFLRGFYRQRLLSIPWRVRRDLSERAARRLASLPAFKDAQTVGLYAGIDGEVETGLLFELCQRAGKAVAVPVVFPREVRMEYSLLAAPVRWTRNPYGIAEPAERRLLDPRNLELLVVPGRAFTPEGRRLGAGAGYYDRYLERHPGAATAALAFDEQVVPALPFSATDRDVDAVVTPTKVHSREASGA